MNNREGKLRQRRKNMISWRMNTSRLDRGLLYLKSNFNPLVIISKNTSKNHKEKITLSKTTLIPARSILILLLTITNSSLRRWTLYQTMREESLSLKLRSNFILSSLIVSIKICRIEARNWSINREVIAHSTKDTKTLKIFLRRSSDKISPRKIALRKLL